MARTSRALAASSYCQATGQAGHRLLVVFCSTTTLRKRDKSELQEMGHDDLMVIVL